MKATLAGQVEIAFTVKWSIDSDTHLRTVDLAVDHALIDVTHE